MSVHHDLLSFKILHKTVSSTVNTSFHQLQRFVLKNKITIINKGLSRKYSISNFLKSTTLFSFNNKTNCHMIEDSVLTMSSGPPA